MNKNERQNNFTDNRNLIAEIRQHLDNCRRVIEEYHKLHNPSDHDTSVYEEAVCSETRACFIERLYKDSFFTEEDAMKALEKERLGFKPMLENNNSNPLSAFTTEELREELKRRAAAEKAAKEERRNAESTCRNCKFLMTDDRFAIPYYKCAKRQYTIKKYNRVCNYKTSLSKTCDNFERKEN